MELNIQETYKLIDNAGVCPEYKRFAKNIIKVLVGEKPVTAFFQIGERYVNSSFYSPTEPYICANFDGKLVALISLESGNRWSDPCTIEDLNSRYREQFKKVL